MGGRGDDTGERVRDHGVAGYPGGRLCPARLCCLLRLYPCGTHGLQRLQGHTLARDHGLVYHRRTFCGGGDAPPGVSHPRRRPAPRRDHGGCGLFRPPHPGIFPARHHRGRGGRKGDRGRIRVRPGSWPGLGRRAYHRQWTGRRGQLAALRTLFMLDERPAVVPQSCVALLLILSPGAALAAGSPNPESLGHSLSLAWGLPFILMLLAIAILPLWRRHWWERNLNKLWVSVMLGTPVFMYYIQWSPHSLLETGSEFVSFIILLASLYVVSGGILLTGDLRATPQTNTAFLAVGTILASLIGTTGASMLLIRPLLNTNRERLHKSHTVVFFIFLVSNIGGSLTPPGDPPLFMGYLEGVPFQWTFRLARQWLSVSAFLLLLYFIWDTVTFSREPMEGLVLGKI